MAKSPYPLLQMEDCVCFSLRSASRAVSRFYDAALRNSGLKITQTPLLGGLASHPEGLTMAQLSDWLEMDRTTLLRNLLPLEKQGWIEAKTTNRKRLLRLTPAGLAALHDVYPHWRKAQDEILATLGKERWASLVSDLETAAAVLASQIEK